MKELFKEFYIPTDDETSVIWSSEETLFIFDTNVLLNFYSFEKATQNDLLKVLELIKSRVWIPFHVALEFQRRRLDVIKNEKKQFSSMDSELSQLSEKINTHLGDNLKTFKLGKKFPNIEKVLNKEVAKIGASLLNIKKEIQKVNSAQMEVRSVDSIRGRIDSIFENKIGSGYEAQEDLQKIYEEGALRYQKLIPPGYNDRSKDRDSVPTFMFRGLVYERKYGDLLIFKQIINKVKSSKIKNVIFVTDDTKDDWWEIVQSNGEKLIGPRLELKSELYKEAQAENLIFYTSENFLKEARTILHVAIDDKSLVDIKESVKDIKYFINIREAKTKEREDNQPRWIFDKNGVLREDNSPRWVTEREGALREDNQPRWIFDKNGVLREDNSPRWVTEREGVLREHNVPRWITEREGVLREDNTPRWIAEREEIKRRQAQTTHSVDYERARALASWGNYEGCRDALLQCEHANILTKLQLMTDISLDSVRESDWFKELLLRLPD